MSERILAIDHGKRTGWAFTDREDGKPTQWGTFDYSDYGFPEILEHFERDLILLASKQLPDVVLLELPVHFQNANSTRKLVPMWGKLQDIYVNAFNLEVHDIIPVVMKKAVTGNGRAEKWDVAQAVADRYGMKLEEIAEPQYYKTSGKGFKKGDLKPIEKWDFDTTDAMGLIVTYVESKEKERVR